MAFYVLLSVVGMLGLAPGCAGKSISRSDRGTDDDERGGTAGTGGKGGTTGTAGTAGTGTAGTSGTGGTIPSGGNAGAGITGGSSGTSGTGGAPSCGPLDGPRRTPSARLTIPFSLTLGGAGGQGGHAAVDEDVVAESGSGGVGDLGGCEPITDGQLCLGTAQTTKRGTELSFQFEDGSTLAWTAVGETYVAPPEVTHGALVYIHYQHQTLAVCPLCGGYTETSLTMWDSRQRQTLWLGREGSLLEEVEPELIASLFGTPYRRTLSCVAEPFDIYCHRVTRELYDHVLGTMPERRIQHAIPTEVVTPRGRFEVMWASAEQTEEFLPMCYDGPAPSRDRGFAVSRLDPAPF